METKHSSGEWTLETESREGKVTRIYIVFQQENGERGQIIFPPELIKESRLIAAAPALLEFAEFVLRGLEAGHVKSKPVLNLDPNAEQADIKSLHSWAREVIAKATQPQEQK